MPEPEAEVLRIAQSGFDLFTSGDEAIVEFIHPECKWEENQLMGFPGLDSVYRGREGVRKWMSDTHEAWARLRCVVESVEPLAHAVVVATRLMPVGSESEASDMQLYNVFWERDGMTVRRRIYFDREEARRVAATPESLLG